MVVAGRSHSWTPPAGHLLGYQPEWVPKAVKSCPFGSRGMKKVDLGLAASSLRRVGGPALQPSHQHCSLHRPGLRFPCSQTWEGLPCLQPLPLSLVKKKDLKVPPRPVSSAPSLSHCHGRPGPSTPMLQGTYIGPGGPSTGLRPLSVGFTHGGRSPPSMLWGLIPFTVTALAFCSQYLRYFFILLTVEMNYCNLITLKHTANPSSFHLNFSIES